jgi:hypothetical protein
VKRGTLRGGVRLFDAGLRRLSAFPVHCCGLDRTSMEQAALADREWAARVVAGEVGLARERAFPELLVVDETQMPPRVDW